MGGGQGRDTIFAREAAFPLSLQRPRSRQQEAIDYLVDCGPWSGSGNQYGTVSYGEDAEGNTEQAYNCPGLPTRGTSITELLTMSVQTVARGYWPWFVAG
jgi:hypothetical protein